MTFVLARWRKSITNYFRLEEVTKIKVTYRILIKETITSSNSKPFIIDTPKVFNLINIFIYSKLISY